MTDPCLIASGLMKDSKGGPVGSMNAAPSRA